MVTEGETGVGVGPWGADGRSWSTRSAGRARQVHWFDRKSEYHGRGVLAPPSLADGSIAKLSDGILHLLR
jgi:hypothetical protein